MSSRKGRGGGETPQPESAAVTAGALIGGTLSLFTRGKSLHLAKQASFYSDPVILFVVLNEATVRMNSRGSPTEAAAPGTEQAARDGIYKSPWEQKQ